MGIELVYASIMLWDMAPRQAKEYWKNVESEWDVGLNGAGNNTEGEIGREAFRSGNSRVINSMSKEELQANLPDGWTYTEHNGRIHIKDVDGNFRVRIDPPDKVTTYQHMHIYDGLGNPLDIDGNIVGPKGPDGHIPWNN